MQLPLDIEYPRLCVGDARPWGVVVQRHFSSLPLVLLTCCPPLPCGRLSRPRTTMKTPPRGRVVHRRWTCPATSCQGDTVTVPTFTDLRLTGTVPGYTPAISLHTIAVCVQPRLSHRLATQPSECAMGFCASRTAAAHIRQIRAGGRIEGPLTPIHFRCTFPSRFRGRGVWQCRHAATLLGLLPVSRASPRSTCPQLLATAASVAG
jgi:hypothetical protein